MQNKDKQKLEDDKIFDLNQEISKVRDLYEQEKSILESQYGELIKIEDDKLKQQMQEIIENYKLDATLSKSYVDNAISELRITNNDVVKKIFQEKLDSLKILESDFL